MVHTVHAMQTLRVILLYGWEAKIVSDCQASYIGKLEHQVQLELLHMHGLSEFVSITWFVGIWNVAKWGGTWKIKSPQELCMRWRYIFSTFIQTAPRLLRKLERCYNLCSAIERLLPCLTITESIFSIHKRSDSHSAHLCTDSRFSIHSYLPKRVQDCSDECTSSSSSSENCINGGLV